MRVRRRDLGGPALVRDWLAGRGGARAFLPWNPADPEAYLREEAALDPSRSRMDRESVAGTLRGGGPEGRARLRRFVREDGYVVTTGHQPVLFGGPLYVLYKALTVVGLAARLERAVGRPVLPVFWIASEDHDWEEARGVGVLDRENELRVVALPAADRMEGAEAAGSALHRLPAGPALATALDELLSYLPETDFSGRWRTLLEQACRPEETLPGAFGRIVEGLLADRGLFLLQSHAPELKRHTTGLLLDELEASGEREEALRARASEIEAAGYELQVPILEGATNLFLEGPAGRERLLRDGAGFRLRRSGERMSHAEIRARLDADPAALSPNVLLRPVVESAFLPTLAYVGGPGEAAYLAQAAPLFRAHGVPRPAVHPRLSADLIERKVDKVLDRHGLEAGELLRPHHELVGRLLREELPEDVRAALGAFRGTLAERTRDLAEATAAVDPTLRASVEQVGRQGMAHLDEVERKLVRALERRNQITLDQLEKARRHLRPEGRPQERVLTFWYYLFRYGEGLLDRLAAEVEAGAGIPPATQ